MKLVHFIAVFTLGLALAACGAPSADKADTGSADSEFQVVNGVKTKNVEGFDGVIAES